MEIKFNIKRKKERVVKKSNTLVPYKEIDNRLTVTEQKVFQSCVIEMKQVEDGDGFRYLDMKDILGKSKLSKKDYDSIRVAAKSLVNTSISINEKDNNGRGRWREISIFDEIAGVEGSSVIQFKFGDSIRPFLENLTKNYSSYLYSNIVSMRSNFSIRLYEILLRQAKWNKTYDPTLAYLKELLGVSNVKSYERFAEFRKTVLDKAKKEINEQTDLYIEYEPIKKGRAVHAIKFYAKFKEQTPLVEETGDNENIKETETSSSPDNSTPDKNKLKEIDKSLIDSLPNEIADKVSVMQTLGLDNDTIKIAIEKLLKESQKVSISDSGSKDNHLTEIDIKKQEVDKKKKRLFNRLKEYNIDVELANDIVTITQADKETGIWKVLYDFNLKVQDGMVKNTKALLEKILRDKFID